MKNGLLFCLLLGTLGLSFASPVATPAPKVEAKLFETKVPDQKTFDRLQRTYFKRGLGKYPHILFVIDRAQHKIYYAHSPSFDYHENVAENLGYKPKVAHDSPAAQSSRDFFEQNYLLPDRKLILGTLSRPEKFKKFYFEFDGTDRINEALVDESYKILKESFYAPVTFKPNSLAQEELRRRIGDRIPSQSLESFGTARDIEVYHEGTTTGVLTNGTPSQDWHEDSIVVFNEAPLQIVPLRGLITLNTSSPLAHIHMLARAWKVPDVQWKTFLDQHAGLFGQWVTLVAGPRDRVVLRKAKASEIAQAQQRSLRKTLALQAPPADLTTWKLADLTEQRQGDSIRYGAKSANLGEMMPLKALKIPGGFGIPFAYYEEFFRESGLQANARKLVEDKEFQASDTVKKEKLTKLREAIQAAPMKPERREAILKVFRTKFAGKGVFVRSSTNAEDLAGFNGAGLYTSVPNVQNDEALIEAVKTVWASVWNFEAFKARETAGMDHFKVYAGVLVQLGMKADSAGVMITRNPYSFTDKNSLFINAKKGIGIKVVNGEKLPEQILYNVKTGTAMLVSRSEEGAYLVFDPNGGLKEIRLELLGDPVLTDALVKKLARAGLLIEKHFKGVPQDIEWLVVDGETWIVQSRPYLD